jgi:hypothetical protein
LHDIVRGAIRLVLERIVGRAEARLALRDGGRAIHRRDAVSRRGDGARSA